MILWRVGNFFKWGDFAFATFYAKGDWLVGDHSFSTISKCLPMHFGVIYFISIFWDRQAYDKGARILLHVETES